MDLNMELSIFEIAFIAAVFLTGMLVGRMFEPRAGGGQRKQRNRPPRHQQQGSSSSGAVEIYVGNLSYDVEEKEMNAMFAKYGKVISARIIRNRFNDRSKGFGFVEMPNQSEANAAISAINGMEIKGRRITVNEARSSAR